MQAWRVLMHQYGHCVSRATLLADAAADAEPEAEASRLGRPLRKGYVINSTYPRNDDQPGGRLSAAAAKSKLPYVGGYAQSAGTDLFSGWHYRYERAAYSTTVQCADGEGGLDGRERPKIFFDDAGTFALLVNGVRFPPNPKDKDIFTFVQPIDRSMDF